MRNSFVKTWLSVLGVGMLILWIAGLSSPDGSSIMTWLDLLMAALTFVGIVLTKPQTDRRTRAGGTIALGLGVLALWLGGLVYGAVPWMTWWNFVFACGYLFVGVAAAMSDDRERRDTSVPFRRSA